ncbi:MAG: hypothetical protein ACK559_22180, partial [bacterium]
MVDIHDQRAHFLHPRAIRGPRRRPGEVTQARAIDERFADDQFRREQQGVIGASRVEHLDLQVV